MLDKQNSQHLEGDADIPHLQIYLQTAEISKLTMIPK